MSLPAMQRRSFMIGAAFTPFFIASCASNTPAKSGFSSKETSIAAGEPLRYSGRISLVIDDPAPSSASSFSGAFNIRGLPAEGEMQLLSPLGQVVASFVWQPRSALLIQGQQTRPFNSVDDMLAQTLGVSVSAEQLFAWLRGEAGGTSDVNWQIDLSRYPEGRILARRLAPQALTLRIILDQL